MPTVDSKGRIVLPKAVRERLDIEPGTEVEVQESDGKLVVEPERAPDEIIERMESLIDDATRDRSLSDDEFDVYARDHAETIRRQAQNAERDGDGDE